MTRPPKQAVKLVHLGLVQTCIGEYVWSIFSLRVMAGHILYFVSSIVACDVFKQTLLLDCSSVTNWDVIGTSS